MHMTSSWQHRLISLLPHCTTPRHLQTIHALLLTASLLHPSTSSTATFTLSRLVLSSSSFDLHYASLLVRHSPSPPNTFILNTLIRSYSRSPQPHLALSYFLLMLRSPAAAAAPNHHSFPFALAACIAIPSLSTGTQIHCILVKNGLASADPFVDTALLRLYTAHCLLDLALMLFDEMLHRDAVQFDVLMNAYLRTGSPEKAVQLFGNMMCAGITPDAHAVTTAITACSHAGALKQGVWIHKHLLGDDEMVKDTYIASALVNMYAKCGSIQKAVEVFNAVQGRNTFLWSAMIGGFAMHGHTKDAMECFARMQEEGIWPDGIVILSMLAACAHAGLVEEGLQLLAEMEPRYCVVPQNEHYSCAVDMLCRVGRLDDAVELIRKMPMRPLASVWGSLLTGCRIHRNVELAELAVGELQELSGKGGDDEGAYVQLSNIYLNANKLEDARRVRKLIGRRGIKKAPAVSSIEAEGVVSSFVAADQVHPKRVEIEWMLELVSMDIRCRLSNREAAREDEQVDGFVCVCFE